MYCPETKYSRKLRNMRNAKQRKRLEGEPPDYPTALPNLRRRIIVVDYDSGKTIRYCIDLYKTNRIDCYRAVANGKEWKDKIGWSKVVEAMRKSFIRVRNVNY